MRCCFSGSSLTLWRSRGCIGRTTLEANILYFPLKARSSFLAWQTVGPSLALFLLSLAAVSNNGSIFQYSATVALGSGLLYYAIRQVFLRSRTAARQLLKASIVYLPLEFLILVLARP